jgi:hypothetical protein
MHYHLFASPTLSFICTSCAAVGLLLKTKLVGIYSLIDAHAKSAK